MAGKKSSLTLTRRQLKQGWAYLLFQILILPSLLTSGNALLPEPLSPVYLNFVFYVLNFLSIILIFRTFLCNSLRAFRAGFWSSIQAAVLGFAAYQLSSYLLSSGISWLFPEFFNVNDASIAAMAREHFPLMTFSIIVLVPPVEECLYRELIFRQISPASRAAAYFLSVTVFGAIHVLGYLGTCSPGILSLCFLQYIPAGLWLAWTYQKAGNILAPIFLHAAINAIGIFSMR